MHIVIMGCGRVGSALAQTLEQQGHTVAVVDQVFHLWWLLPILGVIVGWTTNLLGMQLIFEPVEPRKWGPIKMHGLFLRRQDECAEDYARVIAEEVITLERIGDFLVDGPRVDLVAPPVQAVKPVGAATVAVGAAGAITGRAGSGPSGVTKTPCRANTVLSSVDVRPSALPDAIRRAKARSDTWFIAIALAWHVARGSGYGSPNSSQRED